MSLLADSLLFIGTAAIARGLLRKQDFNESNLTEFPDEPHKALSMPAPEQTLNLLRNRRSIFTKQFTGQQVPRSVIEDMLEAAQWAPNHHITEPWRFIIYESCQGRESVGHLLQNLYKTSCSQDENDETSKSKPFSQAKYDKKLKGAMLSSHIIAICVKKQTKNPLVEEICSVAMAVQNMHIMATSHGVGAYWSSGGVNSSSSKNNDTSLLNPEELIEFLDNDCTDLCLGWLYVGDYYGSSNVANKKWPSGRRSGMANKVTWR